MPCAYLRYLTYLGAYLLGREAGVAFHVSKPVYLQYLPTYGTVPISSHAPTYHDSQPTNAVERQKRRDALPTKYRHMVSYLSPISIHYQDRIWIHYEAFLIGTVILIPPLKIPSGISLLNCLLTTPALPTLPDLRGSSGWQLTIPIWADHPCTAR